MHNKTHSFWTKPNRRDDRTVFGVYKIQIDGDSSWMLYILNEKSKNSELWKYSTDIRKWAEDIAAVIAMSGTPVSVGPVDIKGPLMGLTSSQESDVINDLDEMDKRFNEMLDMDHTSTDMTTIISNFGALCRPPTLRRTEESL